jgi:hypothetical protein
MDSTISKTKINISDKLAARGARGRIEIPTGSA